MTTTRTEIIGRLLELPATLCEAEGAVVRARIALAAAKDRLETLEDALLLDPEALTGRNAEARAAQMREMTGEARQTVNYRQAEVWGVEMALRGLQNELSALRAAARLLAGEAD